MSICRDIAQDAQRLSAISAVIGGALGDASDALKNAIEELSPFVEDEAAPNGTLGDGDDEGKQGDAASEGETI